MECWGLQLVLFYVYRRCFKFQQETKDLVAYPLEHFARLLFRFINKNMSQSFIFILPSQNIYPLNSPGTFIIQVNENPSYFTKGKLYWEENEGE